ncbi:MAG: DUF6456 domain-containing protein [Roseibium sp.]
MRRTLSHGEDFGSQQREFVHGQVDLPDTNDGKPVSNNVQVNVRESPLTWLASRKDKKGRSLLHPEQVRAGERLRADYTFASLILSYGSSWRSERIGARRGAPTSRDFTDVVVSARRRVEGVLSRLGPELAGVAIDVCCHLKGLETIECERDWPTRSGKVVLQIALSSLASLYGEKTEGPDKNGQV